MAFLRGMFLHRRAQSEIVSQQFVSRELAGKRTLSNTRRFRASQMFRAMAMNMVAHSSLCRLDKLWVGDGVL
jgi:hypothetical protein